VLDGGHVRFLRLPASLLGVGILATLIAGVVAASLVMVDGGRIRLPADFSAGESLRVERGQAVMVGDVMLCVTGTSHALSIDAVQPIDPTGGFRVAAFATRPNPNLVSSNGRRRDVSGSRTVQPCEPPTADTEGQPLAPTELVVTLVRQGAGRASAQGMIVRYADEHGQRHALKVPLRLALCPTSAPADCTV
jgi:hypothetical protein